MTADLSTLAAQWLAAKDDERMATEYRRELEDRMVAFCNVPESLDGTENVEAGDYRIKIVGRITRKVDGDLAQEIAAEFGLSEHLQSLFRWKPELNVKAWERADQSITGPLSRAITATPGRPSFSITKEEQ